MPSPGSNTPSRAEGVTPPADVSSHLVVRTERRSRYPASGFRGLEHHHRKAGVEQVSPADRSALPGALVARSWLPVDPAQRCIEHPDRMRHSAQGDLSAVSIQKDLLTATICRFG
jgi:hypothetical protein